MPDLFEELSPPYGTIVADPPWAYATTGQLTKAKRYRPDVAENYSTMTVPDIAALPVASLAAKDAHLYLWATNPKLFDRPGPADVMAAWGFRYVTMLTWVKVGTMGMGYYFRGDTEHVLFGVRGNAPIPPEDRVRNVFTAPKTGHSRKPTLFFDIIDRVSSPEPRVELFCREPRLGWDSWGHGYEMGRTV